MARSMVSRDMLALRAATRAERNRGFMLGSGKPARAAVVNSRISLVKTLARLASCAPLRCMMFLNWEWPDIETDPESATRPWPPSLEDDGQAAVIVKASIWQELGGF